MRKLHINSVQPGDRTAKSIFTESGNVLLGVGVELNQRYIERLRTMGIDTLFIEDKHTNDIIPEDVIRDETRRKAVESVFKTMTGLMNEAVNRGRATAPELGNTFRKVFGSIMNDLVGRRDILVNLTNLNVLDGYLFHHSVNVAILAGIIGLSKGYNQSQLADLGVGALLFDIGMTKLPKELWNKKGLFTAEERNRIGNHTEDGFNMLRTQYDVSLLSAHCALQHHERYNGSGYPRQLQNKQIHEYAQIVAIADVYDALTSPRAYRNRYTPSEAIEFLFASGNSMFDLELLKLFCRHISIYPIATTVVLSSGQIGVVARVDPQAIHRPIIRIVHEANGQPVPSPYEIDLQKQYNLTITKTL